MSLVKRLVGTPTADLGHQPRVPSCAGVLTGTSKTAQVLAGFVFLIL